MPHNNTKEENNGFERSHFYDTIIRAEAAFGSVEASYKADRNYIENVQEPTHIPDGKSYITEDKITDLHRRLIGAMISGDIDISLVGGGDKKKPLKELFKKIMKYNMFKEKVVEHNMNFFYGEGLAWVKYDFDPFKKSPFGIGSPTVTAYRPGEGMFDPESIDLMHYDDNLTIFKFRKTLKYVKEKWPEKAAEVVASQESYGGVEAEEFAESEYVDLYEIDQKVVDFTEEKAMIDGKEQTIKIEEDAYKRYYIANRTVTLEQKNLDANDFAMISMIHTGRIDYDNKYGRYPFGPVRLLAGSQDVLNIITSIMVEVVKKDIKNLALISGANEEEVENYKNQAAEEHGVVTFNNPEARVNFAPKTGLAPSMVQLRNIIAFTFDSQTGKFSPDRGEIDSANLSGVAIGKLQARGALPEFVAKNHIEIAYTRLARQILHSIKTKMKMPFSIEEKINGKDTKIFFNTDAADIEDLVGTIDKDYNINTEGVINDLTDVEVDVSVKIEMNLEEKKNFELQKAFTLSSAGKLSIEDMLMTAYPDTYQEKLENLRKENKAFQLLERIQNIAPEQLEAVDAQVNEIEQIIPELEAITKRNGKTKEAVR